MRTELGNQFCAYDKYVNAATGVLITVIGWATAFAGLRYQFPRPLAVGIILGTSLAAIPFIADFFW